MDAERFGVGMGFEARVVAMGFAGVDGGGAEGMAERTAWATASAEVGFLDGDMALVVWDWIAFWDFLVPKARPRAVRVDFCCCEKLINGDSSRK